MASREELKEIMKELLTELVDEAVIADEELEPSIPGPGDHGTLSSAAFFENAGLFVRVMSDEVDDLNGSIDLGSAYKLIATSLSALIDYGFVEDDSDWSAVITLFYDRADEFVGGEASAIPDLVLSPAEAAKFLEFVVRRWELHSEAATLDGTFTAAERVMMIKNIIVSARNNRHLDRSAPWVRQIIHQLGVDYNLLGGGWSNTEIPPGEQPWSSARRR